ncbi:MAG: ribonuclease III domain-containing protein [Akkermansiaceae bacterium]|jgi:hypothetical protein
MKKSPEEIDKEREEAWVGDAVLALYVREWLLREHGKIDGEAFIRATSNDFLRLKGNPTSVEAEIGRSYREGGLQAGFDYVEQKLLPLFVQREKVRARQKSRR